MNRWSFWVDGLALVLDPNKLNLFKNACIERRIENFGSGKIFNFGHYQLFNLRIIDVLTLSFLGSFLVYDFPQIWWQEWCREVWFLLSCSTWVSLAERISSSKLYLFFPSFLVMLICSEPFVWIDLVKYMSNFCYIYLTVKYQLCNNCDRII